MRTARWVLFVWLAVCMCMPAALADTGTVTASALVVRAGPGQDYDMLGELPNALEVTLLTYQDGWYQIEYNGGYGYVSGRYIRVALPDGGTGIAPEAVYEEPATQTPPVQEEGVVLPGDELPVLVFDEENNPGYPMVMKPGDMGNSVLDLQGTLQQLGYAVNVDGQYGYDTQAAVMQLQRALGIDADGLVGAQTRRMIGGFSQGAVELLDWWLGGNVAYARLTEATVIDVRSGQRFRISRYGGDHHCDVEPLTASDTATFKALLGGEWTWERRPIWLVVNGRVIAASMNCMPHEGEHIQNNDFAGHFCIHFYNSRTHDTDRVDEAHAACVQEAWDSRDRYSP